MKCCFFTLKVVHKFINGVDFSEVFVFDISEYPP